MDRKRQARTILQRLNRRFPEAKVSLDFKQPLELLVATILSAQCTDARVNLVTKTLFKKYRKAQDYAYANRKELEKDIRSTGYYRQKARHIQEACKTIVEEFAGTVPRTMEDIQKLQGVGRKTANVVLGNAYGIQEGIPVDTHVSRLSKRLGLTKNKEPEKIERDLLAVVPAKQRLHFSNLLIFHGRAVCNAKRPHCSACTLNDLCPCAYKIPGSR